MSSQKSILVFIILFANTIYAQSKYGNTWIVGPNSSYAKFDGTSNRPISGRLFPNNAPYYPYNFEGGNSCISDCVTGNLLFATNAMTIYLPNGTIMDNGVGLQPPQVTNVTSGASMYKQSSLILPKGTNGEYYVFISTVSDSTFLQYWGGGNNPNKNPNDLLLYNVVDMKANNGTGKVVTKNVPLLTGVHQSRVAMQAVKHANGQDWWLYKHALNDNTIYRFLVTANGITGPTIQSFTEPKFGYESWRGQAAFSNDGTKYAVVQYNSNKIFIADFNRSSGALSNPKVFNTPMDSTGYPYLDNQGYRDDVITGVCFSNNNKYAYITKSWNVYQFEYGVVDSSQAWYRVQHGSDTTWQAFEYFEGLHYGPDGRMYIGKFGGSLRQFSVIDNPDNKGVACNFCRKCFRVDTAWGGLTGPSNMPNYNLGFTGCYPTSAVTIEPIKQVLEIYPNPANNILNIEGNFNANTKVQIFNYLGQAIQVPILQKTNAKIQIQTANLPQGMYYIKMQNTVSKFIKE